MGGGEGLSGLREQPGQRHGGQKLHGTLRTTGEDQPWSRAHWSPAHLRQPVRGCSMDMGWGRGSRRVRGEAKELGRNLAWP